MAIREKVVLLAVLLMVFIYLILLNLVPPKNHNPGIPAKTISEPITKKDLLKGDVFFPPTLKNIEEDQIVEETVLEGE